MARSVSSRYTRTLPAGASCAQCRQHRALGRRGPPLRHPPAQRIIRLIRLTAKKRMRATLTAIRDKLYQRRHEPVPIIGKWLHRVLMATSRTTQSLRICCD